MGMELLSNVHIATQGRVQDVLHALWNAKADTWQYMHGPCSGNEQQLPHQ